MVTAAEADAIVAQRKIIAANLAWRYLHPIYRLEATVLVVETNTVCSLRGFIGRTNHSFALLFQNTPIRKWTAHDRHRNPLTGEVVTQPHKHVWNDVHEDRVVYIPDDIRVGDINVEFMDFLRECNIELRGQYTPFRRVDEPHEQLDLGI